MYRCGMCVDLQGCRDCVRGDLHILHGYGNGQIWVKIKKGGWIKSFLTMTKNKNVSAVFGESLCS